MYNCETCAYQEFSSSEKERERERQNFRHRASPADENKARSIWNALEFSAAAPTHAHSHACEEKHALPMKRERLRDGGARSPKR